MSKIRCLLVVLTILLMSSLNALSQNEQLFHSIETKNIQLFNESVITVTNYSITNNEGLTLLALCSKSGFLHGANYLLAENVNVDEPSVNGLTPLMYASENGYSQIVHLLLSHNANVHINDANSMNALDHCSEAVWSNDTTAERNHSACFQLLLERNN
jgi:ankyrin repeat protein